MSGVKWIKITTNMFDDEKIKLIRKLPDSDSILLTWIQLLTQAGKANASGSIVLSETIPYTDEMLSVIFDRPVSVIRLALQTFQQFGMIDIDSGVISISNWEKHQNVDGMEKIREQTRKRVKEHREKQKLLSNGECNVTVTNGNAIDIDKERDIDIEEDINKKIKVADFVSLSKKEHQELVDKLGPDKAADIIEDLNLWKGSKGKRTKSDYLTILNWLRRENKENKTNAANKQNSNDLYAGKDFGF